MTGDAAIECAGLLRLFGDNRAVDGIDLAVSPGEIYGFLGPNGAGKSTLVRMLCTLLLPTAGHARVAGWSVVDEPGEVRLRIGVALQEAGLDGRQTGREILGIQGRLYGLRGDDLVERIEAACTLIDIGDAIDDLVQSYSGGMKRRLDLASALVHEPEVLFLDEPTTGLDPVSRLRVWEEVRRLNDELGMTIFLTTQYLEEADELADRVGIINDGRLVTEGRPETLKRRVGTDLVVALVDGEITGRTVERLEAMGTTECHGDEIAVAVANGAEAVAEVAVILSDGGLQTRSLTVRTPTLDDVFLMATGHRIEPEADEVAAEMDEAVR